MLLQYFGLRENPFGSAPDPRFLYLHGQHGQVLSQLRRGFSDGIRLQILISYTGGGKTTVLRALKDYLEDRAQVVYLGSTLLPAGDLLNQIAVELKLAVTPSTPLGELRKLIEDAFRSGQECGRTIIVILDEAHDLEDAAVAEISGFLQRLPKSAQFILSGQPKLHAKLQHPAMLNWRLLRPLGLSSLSTEEVIAYVQHRLAVAGYAAEPLFASDALDYISEKSEGIPQAINRLCSDALMKAFTQGKKVISRELLENPVDYTEHAHTLEHVVDKEPAPAARAAAPSAAPARVSAAQRIWEDPFANAVVTWLSQRASIWTGTAGELLSGLRDLNSSTFGSMGTEELLQLLQSNRSLLLNLGIATESRQNVHGPKMIVLKLLDPILPIMNTKTPAEFGNQQLEDQKKVG